MNGRDDWIDRTAGRSLPAIDRRALRRFMKYLLAGGGTFALDLLLLFVRGGYAGSIVIAGSGLAIVTAGMYVLNNVFQWHYAASRIAVVAVTGMANYLLNLYVNFRVAGHHPV